jgi:outer membrane protein assembly factor BamB
MTNALPRCALAAIAVVCLAADWPEWLGPGREGVWREDGLVDKFPEGGPKVLWRTPLGAGYSGPAVVGGRVYVMDRKAADAGPVSDTERRRGEQPGNERVVCLDAASGQQIWAHEYDCPYKISYNAGPRTTPLVRDGRVYALGAMGDLRCLDAADGKPRWAVNLVKEYKVKPPVWGWAASPLLDGDLLYCMVGGDGSTVVAINKDTGKEVWKALSTEEIGYSPPILVRAGGTRQLIVWHSEAISGLDPATGQVFWSQDYPTDGPPQRPAVNIVTPILVGDRLFIASFYHGPMMLKLAADKPAAEVVWKDQSKSPQKPVGLHPTMASPVIRGGHIYGLNGYGELACYDAATGEQKWESMALSGGEKAFCGTAFLIPQGDRFVIFTDAGELILARLNPSGYEEICKAKVIEPVESARGRTVVWCHPAFANRCVFVRNHKAMVCISLAAAAG